MTVSTGIGGGIVLDGELLDGESGNAGHIGHIIVEPLGRRCGCGAQGCLEAEASGLAIEQITAATFFHSAQVALDENVQLPYSRGARITPSRLADSGPLIGAGAVGWRGVRRAARGVH